MSSSSRQAARALSSSVNQVVVRGKLGRIKKAANAIAMVITPSMINSHFHALIPRAPSRPDLTPAAISPENAPEMRAPEYRTAVLNPSSDLRYQQER
jgi:hypothetical protein